MENANGVIKKLTSAERSYYTAAEVREGNAGCSDQRIWQDNSSICFQERRREGKSFSCRYPCTVRDQGNSGRNTAWNALY